MKLIIATLDKNGRIWDTKELIPGFTKTGKLNAATEKELAFAIKNMDSKFVYTVDKIEIYRIDE